MSESKTLEQASSFSLGVTVVLLYVLFVTAVFSGFATYIYRSEWQTAYVSTSSTTGRVSDIDNIIFVIKRERELLDYLGKIRAQQFEIEAKQVETEGLRDIAFGKINTARTNLNNQAFFTLADLRTVSGNLSEADQSKLYYVLDDKALEETERATTALRILDGMAPRSDVPEALRASFDGTLNRLKTDMEQLEEVYLSHNSEAHLAKAELVLISTQLDRLLRAQNEAETELDALQSRVPPGSPERARLAALSTTVPLVGDMFQRLVSFPTIFLTLIVTIAAGGLGTVVAFSRRYYSGAAPEDLTMSRLFVNVGEGIAAAIAIFLFSGAGMLALTQGGGASSDVELSPYTVAFIAFVSGFMAEDAFASIQSAGKRMFRGEGENGGNGGQGA